MPKTELIPPPHDRNAELAVLGSMALMPSAISEAQELINDQHFYFDAHQKTYRAILRMHNAGIAIDAVTLPDELLRCGQFLDVGGMPFILELLDTVPHAAHLKHYANIVTSKWRRRELINRCHQIAAEARLDDSDIDHVTTHAVKLLTEANSETTESSWLGTPFKDAWEAARKPSPPREQIVEGMLRRGEVANIIASTKVGKSWFALQLLFSIASGTKWFGKRVLPGKVLLIDNELHAETLENRLSDMLHFMRLGSGATENGFAYEILRGDWKELERVFAKIERWFKPGELNLIVLDAKYRFFCEGLEENSNDHQTQFHNLIDKFARKMNCAIALIHHASKGDQSGKDVTAIGAGGGAQSRTVDLQMVIRPHEREDHAVIDAKVRSFAPIDPISIRWDAPGWSLAADVEPVLKTETNKTERAQEAKDKTGVEELRKILADSQWPLTRSALHKEFGGGKERLNRLIRLGIDWGTIAVLGERQARNGERAELFGIPEK